MCPRTPSIPLAVPRALLLAELLNHPEQGTAAPDNTAERAGDACVSSTKQASEEKKPLPLPQPLQPLPIFPSSRLKSERLPEQKNAPRADPTRPPVLANSRTNRASVACCFSYASFANRRRVG